MTARSPEEGPDGVLLVDKSAGPTSTDVVRLARRCLDVRRLGHAGTLDPFATGLLLLCVGRATRLVRYLHLLPKSYRARVHLGVETSTHDPEGDVVSRSETWREVDRGGVEAAAAELTGRIEQVPPRFSAVKVGGRRAYEAARAGEELRLEARPVQVDSFRIVSFDPPELEVETVVGAGTYIRGLARDLGRALGCGAHLRTLRRTAIGPFAVAEAVADAELQASGARDLQGSGAWRSPAAALAWLPSRELETDEIERVRHGGAVPRGSVVPGVRAAGPMVSGADGAGSGGSVSPVTLLRAGVLVAVAEPLGTVLQPRVVLDAA
ncbi:MAG: tRNA pseudouridine(55) synthase TruB [Candidatus Palauibacterales bacterium]|nr:tRNA pseudouridine(55) synthase TruB [Candidatus Palauibacterales bacterium]MDP2582936.1 tRNA pseudouridine(55) synthase TruB [Candidatus Palauibacterales bacterium]